MKDRVQLQQYRDKIERFAPQQALITDYLRNSVSMNVVSLFYLQHFIAEYGTQQKHRQPDTWFLLGLAPFVVEEVTVHYTGISLLLSISVWVLLSPPIERRETRPTA